MFSFGQLGIHILVTHNGAGDELGKKRHIGAQRQNVLLGFGIFPVHIDHIGKNLKSIEGDADGQL